MNQFTEQDLKAFRAYERVRKGGRYNMFFPQARRATGLSEERYSFVMEWYEKLRAAEEVRLASK